VLRVSERADERIEQAADDPRDREDEADLLVAQMEITADERPRRRARPADDLVEKLDCEQGREERDRPRDGRSGSAADGHGRILGQGMSRDERALARRSHVATRTSATTRERV
jgi:hypothetical protein